MDTGLSVGVAPPAPGEVKTFELRPELTPQLPSGFLEKPHVRHALKYMEDDEQREKALKAAMAWKKQFAADRWKSVFAAIERTKNEDSVRSLPQDEDSHDARPTAPRPRAKTAAPAPVASQASIQATPSRRWLARKQTVSASLPSASTNATITPRQYRWDIVTSSPATPLTPMLLGNSFSSGGFWSVSTQPQQSESPVESGPEPLTEPKDAEAREVYIRLKRDIDGLARKYCLARFRMDTSGKEDFIPECMVKPRDTEEAAKVILEECKVDMSDAIITDLPERLRRWALDETQLRSQLCIKDMRELAEQNDWMNDETLAAIPTVLEKKDYRLPSTSHAVSILDEQKEALRRFRIQRDLELMMEDSARDSAWAVRMLEDAEHVVATDVDVWSNDSGDDGYDYSNFLRSIKSEMSTSESSGALSRMVEEVEEVSNSGRVSFRFPSLPSTSPSRSSSCYSQQSDFNSTNDSSRSTSTRRRLDLHVVTDRIRKASTTSEVSPEDKEFRHRGPGLADLSYWAEELKRMDAITSNRNSMGDRSDRTALKRLSSTRTKGRESPTNTLHSRFSSSSSSSSSEDPNSPTLSPRALYARSLIDTSPSPLPNQPYHEDNTPASPTPAHRRRTSKTKILFHRPFARFKHRREGSNSTAVRSSSSISSSRADAGEGSNATAVRSPSKGSPSKASITKKDTEGWVGDLARAFWGVE